MGFVQLDHPHPGWVAFGVGREPHPSVFGVPAKAAAELLIDEINAKGCVGGVKVGATFMKTGCEAALKTIGGKWPVPVRFGIGR